MRACVRGVFKRFFPTTLGVFGAFAGAVAFFPSMLGMGLSFAQAMLFGLEVVGLTIGFGVGVGLLKRWLHPTAKVDGHRSIVAGLCSPLLLLLLSLFTQGAGSPAITAYSTLTGMLVGLAVFFPSLSDPSGEEGDFFKELERVL
jgi:hypothetical protein